MSVDFSLGKSLPTPNAPVTVDEEAEASQNIDLSETTPEDETPTAEELPGPSSRQNSRSLDVSFSILSDLKTQMFRYSLNLDANMFTD